MEEKLVILQLATYNKIHYKVITMLKGKVIYPEKAKWLSLTIE